MENLLFEIASPEAEAKRQAIAQMASDSMAAILSEEKASAVTRKFVETTVEQSRDANVMRANIIRNISATISVTGEVYNHSRIEKAVDHVMSLKGSVSADEGRLTQQAYKWLKSHASDKRHGVKKPAEMAPSHITMKNLLLDI